jgi:hypothetical protein
MVSRYTGPFDTAILSAATSEARALMLSYLPPTDDPRYMVVLSSICGGLVLSGISLMESNGGRPRSGVDLAHDLADAFEPRLDAEEDC